MAKVNKPTVPQPNLRTPEAQLAGVELIKRDSNGALGTLAEDFRDHETAELGEAAEQIAKSHGIYLEYNRAKTGREKDWMYMVRMSIPGGGPFNREQWQILDEVSEKVTAGPDFPPSLRVTTRQNIQFHWVTKADVIELVQTVAKTGFFTMNGCGDNARNVMGCPLSRYSEVFNAHAMAHRLAAFLQVAPEAHIKIFGIDPNYLRADDEGLGGTDGKRFNYGPKLLNRKFKIGISGFVRDEATGELLRDNCVEALTNDVAVVPVLEDGRVERLQLFLGGGQGEKNGKPTFAGLGKPVGIVAADDIVSAIDAVATTHKEWGDRQNRHWARLKYVVQAQGTDWWRQQISDFGVAIDEPDPQVEPGPRRLHHGWQRQESNGKWAYGLWIENGRVQDNQRGRYKTLARELLARHDGAGLLTTPNQDLLFVDMDEGQKESFEATLSEFGHSSDPAAGRSTLRLLSGACVGLYTCRLSYTESEQFEPELLDELERRGWGDLAESIGITGCERQCFRPSTKTIGWIGQGPDMYSLRLGGTEDGRHQGIHLIGADPAGGDEEQWFLRRVPRESVADVCEVLFEHHRDNASDGEDLGRFIRRVGMQAIVDHLRAHPKVAPLMEKTYAAPYTPDDQRF